MKKLNLILSSFFALLGFASICASETLNVEFRVFDESGDELSYSEIEKRMTNGSKADYMSSGTFDLDSLKAVTLSTIENVNGSMSASFFDIDAIPRQGLMVHWNTENTGYSSFLLDNGGEGFSESRTYIFNERLAYDARRQFSEALANRPDFSPSVEFVSIKKRIDTCFIQLETSTTASEKGKTGQKCLDLLAQAMNMLLREYGNFRARELDNRAIWGVTIFPGPHSTIQQEHEKIDDLKSLFDGKHRWARIIMLGETDRNFERISNVVRYAANQEVKTMGQLFDSSFQAQTTFTEFKDLVDKALTYPGFENFSAWEVGNEINGDWLGEGIAQKVEYASTRVKSLYPDKMICLTFYWYSMQDTLQSSLFNWIDDHITQTIKDNIDCVTLSIYIDQQPMGFLWDRVMSQLSENFPGKKVMVGELAYSDPSVAPFYREGPDHLSDEEVAQEYIANRYPSSFATPSSIGGGFWWYYDREMVGRTNLWDALRKTYCSTYFELCN